MEIQPLNNIILVRLIGEAESSGGIALPEKQGKRFIKLEVLEVGNKVEIIKKGDKVIANNLFEVIDLMQKDIGFINSVDVLGIIKHG